MQQPVQLLKKSWEIEELAIVASDVDKIEKDNRDQRRVLEGSKYSQNITRGEGG